MPTKHLTLWWSLFLGSLTPFLLLTFQLLTQRLGPDPAQTLTEELGRYAMIWLLMTLAVTPVRQWTGFSLLRYRRMLGLWTFFYALMHFLSYVFLLADWYALLEDLAKRPYILVGAVALSILLALAVTSPKKMVRRLGKRWKPLHRLVYPAAVLVIVHFFWQARADLGEPIYYATALGLLFLARWKRLTGWLRR